MSPYKGSINEFVVPWMKEALKANLEKIVAPMCRYREVSIRSEPLAYGARGYKSVVRHRLSDRFPWPLESEVSLQLRN